MLHISRAGLNFQPEISGPDDIDVDETVNVIKSNKPLIQGVKVRAVGPAVPVMGVEMIRLARGRPMRVACALWFILETAAQTMALR